MIVIKARRCQGIAKRNFLLLGSHITLKMLEFQFMCRKVQQWQMAIITILFQINLIKKKKKVFQTIIYYSINLLNGYLFVNNCCRKDIEAMSHEKKCHGWICRRWHALEWVSWFSLGLAQSPKTVVAYEAVSTDWSMLTRCRHNILFIC